MGRYTVKFEKFHFYNRWKNKYPSDDWTIFGVSKWWFGAESYSYKICLFGLELHIWYKRIFNNKHFDE